MKAFFLALVLAIPALPCSVVGKISRAEMFSQADVIIRAKAVAYLQWFCA